MVPEDYWEAGWWSGGPEPGERGAAVIAGHVGSKNGPAIFYEDNTIVFLGRA